MGKKKDKKDKKDKKKKKEVKKKDKKKKDKKGKKKKESSSSSSSGGSSSNSAANEKPEAKKAKTEAVLVDEVIFPKVLQLDQLVPPEEGIRRFHFEVEEKGPLGLRFSGGFPPLILSVVEGSFAAKKSIPPNWEVHAINGHALVPQNLEVVMSSLKNRPVALDVRPQGWKPKEKVLELQKRREREEAERVARVEMEEKRRDLVAREAAEQAEREAAERAVRTEQERLEREKLERRAREERAKQKEKVEEFQRELAKDPEDLRKAASDLMEADYGSKVRLSGKRRGLPLRLLTRRREVAWLWAGEVMELIGGGVQDDSAWS